MFDDNDLDGLRNVRNPAPRAEARARAVDAALAACDLKKVSAAPQGSAAKPRLTERLHKLWSETMQKKMIAAPALAGLVALPIAGYTALYLVKDFSPRLPEPDTKITETGTRVEATKLEPAKPSEAKKKTEAAPQQEQQTTIVTDDEQGRDQDLTAERSLELGQLAREEPNTTTVTESAKPVAPATVDALVGGEAESGVVAMPAPRGRVATNMAGGSKLMADQAAPSYAPEPMPEEVENRDRFEEFKTNPVRSATTDPVSTFSIDVDTASYSFARRSLKQGFVPQADTVRVEEMVNYFPYDWKGPDTPETPFNTTVTVMPSPWHAGNQLMHVAIKGYELKQVEQPRANLVFLLDVSGSMNEPDKLPLVQSAFRLLISKLQQDDTISIVTYAGDAGTVLMPTKVSERAKILSAIDNLTPG
ncbi:MAG: VWA domain-containing protein, partial [Rhizobiaceae bacterium]